MSIPNIGSSALNSTSVGLAATGHSIANASATGYSRQVTETASVGAEDTGAGFVGKGSEVANLRRVYSEFLTDQVRAAETTNSQLSTYKDNVDQINNILANPQAAISPVMQDFFAGVQAVASDANDTSARQQMISSGHAMVSRFDAISSRLHDLRLDVNSRIRASVDDINIQSERVATLNKAITSAESKAGKASTDLLDARDKAILALSKQVKVSVVKQDSNYNVYISSGQSLVIGSNAASLFTAPSPADSSSTEVGYKSSTGATSLLDEKLLAGGSLGGLMEFRAGTLDTAQNSLGRTAIAVGVTFNEQHAKGATATGDPGSDFFDVARPVVKIDARNGGDAVAGAAITDVTALTSSNYRLQYEDTPQAAYTLTRLSDGNVTTFNPVAAGSMVADGIEFSVQGTPRNGDSFLVQPTVNGARDMRVAINSANDIAAGGAALASAGSRNAGTGAITAPTTQSGTLLGKPVELMYSSGEGTLSGFPSDMPVSVTNGAGTTIYPAGQSVPYRSGEIMSFGGVSAIIDDTAAPPAPKFAIQAPVPATIAYSAATKSFSGFPIPLTVTVTTEKEAIVYGPGVPVPYTPGAVISFGGISFSASGAPADGDTFNLDKGAGGGDNRNALALRELQSASVLDGKTSSLQESHSSMVSAIGGKAVEIRVTTAAAANALSAAIAKHQSVSGLNPDEEVANLVRGQQTYQTAGKVMQSAHTMFQTLLIHGGKQAEPSNIQK